MRFEVPTGKYTLQESNGVAKSTAEFADGKGAGVVELGSYITELARATGVIGPRQQVLLSSTVVRDGKMAIDVDFHGIENVDVVAEGVTQLIRRTLPQAVF